LFLSAYGFAFSRLLGERLVDTVTPEKLASRELDASAAASGPHDFAVRVTRVRLARASRPPHPTAQRLGNVETDANSHNHAPARGTIPGPIH
jgi:hypothetical protein